MAKKRGGKKMENKPSEEIRVEEPSPAETVQTVEAIETIEAVESGEEEKCTGSLAESEVLVEREPIPDDEPTTPEEKKIKEKKPSKLAQIIALLEYKDRVKKSNAFLMSSADMNLACIGYPSLFLSAVVRYIGENPKVLGLLKVFTASMRDGPLKQRLQDPTRLAKRLRTLYSLTSDVRTFIRVWASLDYVEWAMYSLKSPNEDWVLRYVDYAQLIACIGYQLLENIAYLGSHGVLPMSGKREARLWSVSCICWAVHVQLDFIRMFRQKYLNEKSNTAYSKFDFWNYFLANCAYVPLSIHWSLEQGCLPDILVGALGTFTTYTNATRKWKSLLA
ncbi:hypothetical protein TRVA0_009S02146 [Trichomonascus vanleenenianus]|uniref:uncharacterized protein n=1 Tax=Trichomonascus vanleenenianus TaxID=2268995 RepID=UPI003ECAA54F